MKPWTRLLLCGASAVSLLAAAPFFAQEAFAQEVPAAGPAASDKPPADEPNTVVVFGRSENLIGTANAASEGVVGEADFETRPLVRPGELVEVIPGMVATQHAGGGKANQYFLRGFNLDHGTDFAGSLDGVPLNLIAHPHMSGYLDLNFLIPEIVESVAFQKGTGYASNGDHSAAGAANFKTHDEAHENFVEADASDTKDYRLLAMGSTEVGESGAVFGALQYEFGDGPWDNPLGLKKYSGFLKYSTDWGNARFHAELVGYDNEWRSTDQVPLRAIESGLIGRFGSIDTDTGGTTSRYIASTGLDWDKNTSVLAYAESYNFRLYNNFTYFLDDPINSDEFLQATDRTAVGARARTGQTADVAGFNVDWRIGTDIRTDFIDLDGLFHTNNRVPFNTVRDDSGSTTLADVWADATVHWTDAFRTTIGIREDVLWYDFDVIQPENSGSDSDSLFSPKISAAYTFTPDLEGYASYGYSFHTNDPRGGLIHVDPVTGDPVDPADVLVKSQGGRVRRALPAVQRPQPRGRSVSTRVGF